MVLYVAAVSLFIPVLLYEYIMVYLVIVLLVDTWVSFQFWSNCEKIVLNILELALCG